MAIVSAEKFVQAARDNGYAVGGFNTNNLEWTQAILRAAEAKKAPVLIQTSMGAAKYMGGYKVARNLIANLVESVMQLVDLTQTTLSGLKLSCVQQKLRKLQYLSKLLWVLLNTWVVTKYVKPLLKTL